MNVDGTGEKETHTFVRFSLYQVDIFNVEKDGSSLTNKNIT